MPFYCAVCNETFEDEEARDTHIRRRDCLQAAREKPEGITQRQKEQLAKKPPPSQTSKEEQWYAIFEILFPNHAPRPESPYISSSLLADVLRYQEYLIEDGSRILRDFLTDSQAVTWREPDDESDFQTFQLGIVQSGVRAVFDRWLSQGGVGTSEADAGPSAAHGFSDTGEQTPSACEAAAVGTGGGQQAPSAIGDQDASFQVYDHDHGTDAMQQPSLQGWFGGEDIPWPAHLEGDDDMEDLGMFGENVDM